MVYVARSARGRKKYSALFDGPYIVISVNVDHKSVRVMDPLLDIELPMDVGFERLKRLCLTNSDLQDFSVERNSEYEVAAILDHKQVQGELFYLISFVGYAEPEWIRASNCTNCPGAINDYWAQTDSNVS